MRSTTHIFPNPYPRLCSQRPLKERTCWVGLRTQVLEPDSCKPTMGTWVKTVPHPGLRSKVCPAASCSVVTARWGSAIVSTIAWQMDGELNNEKTKGALIHGLECDSREEKSVFRRNPSNCVVLTLTQTLGHKPWPHLARKRRKQTITNYNTVSACWVPTAYQHCARQGGKEEHKVIHRHYATCFTHSLHLHKS